MILGPSATRMARLNWLEQITEVYHGKSERVDLCGVILYTDAHPYLKRALRDQDYWKALNEHSGGDWVVFSVRTVQGAHELPSDQQGYSMLVPVWQEPESNRELLEYFQIESTENLPCLVAYTRAENGELLKLFWRIRERTEEEAYETLAEGLKTVQGALKNILPEYRQYPDGVFRASEMAVTSKVFIKRVKAGLDIWRWLKGLKP